MEKIESCPACGSDKVVYEEKQDELICKTCGQITVEFLKE
jgi:transcription initiation factor TFIIIB Brf1 subunit/transcription initiation factor TFIIB